MSGMPFDGLAEHYARARPGYPSAALAEIAAAIETAPAVAGVALVLDVGAGTGISTRALADVLGLAVRIVGVEPSDDMRRQAQETTAAPNVEYVDGRAEALPAADASAAAIAVAQALQWFDRPRFYAEARRVLTAGGILAVVQNNRAWRRAPFLAAYEELLEAHSPGYSRCYRAFDVAAELTALADFESCTATTFQWERRMSFEDFCELARSSTKMNAVVERYGPERALAMLREQLSERVSVTGRDLVVPYDSELFLARRK